MVQVALLARLEAKPGKEEDVADLLKGALSSPTPNRPRRLVRAEAGAVDVRHLRRVSKRRRPSGTSSGPIAAALMAKAPSFLAKPPVIERRDPGRQL